MQPSRTSPLLVRPVTAHQQGMTLIELMIVLAILTLLSAIAIPLYQGYTQESRLSALRMNANSIQVFLEDYHLDNGSYKVGGATSYNATTLASNFGWNGDTSGYSYSVSVSTNNWSVVVEDSGSGDWVRCEDRMSNCCYSDTSGSTKTAC